MKFVVAGLALAGAILCALGAVRPGGALIGAGLLLLVVKPL